MAIRLLVALIFTVQSAASAVFEVDLWPGEGQPVFEAAALQLRLHERPLTTSKVVETLAVRPKQQLSFDETRYQTIKVGLFRGLAPTTVTGRKLGALSRLSKADYYSGRFGQARVDVAAGNVIEYLQYRAEGTCFIRIETSVIDADPCPTQKKGQFSLEVEPTTEWWIQITRAGKPVGWLLITASTAKVIARKG